VKKSRAIYCKAKEEEYGDSVTQGLIIYPGDHCYSLSEQVTALPFDALMKPRSASMQRTGIDQEK